jgi:hypothetical protein
MLPYAGINTSTIVNMALAKRLLLLLLLLQVTTLSPVR